MYVIPARWGFEGVITQERLAISSNPAWVMDLGRPDTTSVENFVYAGKFKCAEAQIAAITTTGSM